MRRPGVPAVLVLATLWPTPSFPATAPGDDGAVREPALAGRFYPAPPAELRAMVERFLAQAAPPAPARPVAIVVPHAGYAYSGQVAAEGWRRAAARAPDLVVLLGTNHTAPGLRGAALAPGRGFRTPLGVVEIDGEARDALARLSPDVILDAGPHAREHSVEVQLPFVQVLFPGARILPLVVGAEDLALPERLGRALASLVRGRNALVVASSDLSHYPSARDAAEIDRRVLQAVASLDPERLRATLRAEEARGVPGLGTCACGEAPILTAMAAARALGAARGTVVRQATSADVPFGDAGRVVGYGAVAFEGGPAAGSAAPPGAPPARGHGGPAPPPGSGTAPSGPDAIDGTARAALLAHARDAIARHLAGAGPPSGAGLPPAASLPRGAFVTLKKAGELRGCIGRLEGAAPLGATVAGMAVEAAVRDPRFPPVTRSELDQLSIEISVLTPARPVAGPHQVAPGRDGVLLSKGGRRAVFLPQVATEQGWGRDELLDHLCLKAGLPAGCWREGAALQTFQAEVFGEAHRP